MSEGQLRKSYFVNGISREYELDETIYMFSLAESLTEIQMVVLEFIYKNTRSMSVKELATGLGIDPSYAKQLCISLNMAGLLNRGQSAGFIMGDFTTPGGPTDDFTITDYAKRFVGYITDSGNIEQSFEQAQSTQSIDGQ